MISNGICMDCGHRHRGVAQCNFCECVWETVTLDHKWIESIKSWFKKLIFWK